VPINKAEQLAKQFEGRGPQGRRKLLSKLERVGPNKIKTHTENSYSRFIQHADKSVNLIETMEDGLEIYVIPKDDLMIGIVRGKPLQNRRGIKNKFFGFEDKD
ncbi:uncharacterized protein METZ01_LOCUS196407, partial [marine metagenome]|jgi:hypothetical protein|tara:strand:- start:71 stop:379 length:309 start_codon:yes stop_codon:yes gene_type:complete